MLTFEEVIVESNDDLEIWSSIVVGFDIFGNFVIRLDHIDYAEHEHDSRLEAIINKSNARQISDFLHVKLTNLPSLISEKFGETSNLYVPSEVENLFGEILDFILDNGGHYELKRSNVDL